MKTNYIGYKLLSNFEKLSKTKLDNITLSNSNFAPSYNKYISFGDSVHICLEKYNKSIKYKRRLNYKSIEELLKSSWISIGYDSKEEELEFYKRAIEILKCYFSDRKDKENMILFVEEKLTKALPNSDIVLFGKPDKVYINTDGQLEIVDYKTTNTISYHFNPLYDVQTLLYIILVKEKTGVYPSVISRYYLCNNIKVSYRLTEEDITLIKNYFFTVIPIVESYYSNKSLNQLKVVND